VSRITAAADADTADRHLKPTAAGKGNVIRLARDDGALGAFRRRCSFATDAWAMLAALGEAQKPLGRGQHRQAKTIAGQSVVAYRNRFQSKRS